MLLEGCGSGGGGGRCSRRLARATIASDLLLLLLLLGNLLRLLLLELLQVLEVLQLLQLALVGQQLLLLLLLDGQRDEILDRGLLVGRARLLLLLLLLELVSCGGRGGQLLVDRCRGGGHLLQLAGRTLAQGQRVARRVAAKRLRARARLVA